MAKLKPLTVQYVPMSCLLSGAEQEKLLEDSDMIFGDAEVTLVYAVRIERAIGKTAGLSAYMAVYGLRALVDLES